MPRLSEADRAQTLSQTRTKLLDAAAQEFAQRGYSQANVNRIARDAGYSIGTFYNYFPSKRDLMYAFIEEVAGLHVTSLSETVLEEADPERRFVVFFRAGFDFIKEHLFKARAIFNTLNGPDEEFKQRLFQAYQPLFTLVADILSMGMSQRIFHIEDPHAAVNLIMLNYLSTGAQIDPKGKHFLNPDQISGFLLKALQYQEQE